MKSTNALIIWRKELREVLRDKRTFVRMFLLSGLLLPFLGHFMITFGQQSYEDAENDVLHYAIVGGEWLPGLEVQYAEQELLEPATVDSRYAAIDAIREGRIAFAIVVPERAREKLQARERASVAFYYNNAASNAEIIKRRGTEPLNNYSEAQRNWRLTFLGVVGQKSREGLLDPVRYVEQDIASDREQLGQSLGGILAYLIFTICYMGCLFTAIDVATGEKERGTLEILLMAPVARRDLVVGKYLAVLTVGLAYATIAMFSLGSWLLYEGTGSSARTLVLVKSFALSDLALIWLMLVPITALFAALVLAISVYARSFREASNLAGMFNFVVAFAAIIVILPGMELDWLWATVPMTNVAMAIKALVKGTLEEQAKLIVIFLSTSLTAGALLMFCAHWFKREEVVFRE